MIQRLKSAGSVSLVSLIVANLLPLGGVLFAGWDVSLVVLLYWTENLIVGFYNVLRMATARIEHPAEHLGKLFMIPLFCVHYGGFCAVHGFFLLAFFDLGGGPQAVVPGGGAWFGPLVFLQLLVGVMAQLWASAPLGMLWSFLALVASHGVSFVQNHLLAGESERLSLKDLMGRPYGRIVVMHVAIIAGGFFVMALKSPLPLLVILIILKAGLDVKLHLRSHARAGRAKTATTSATEDTESTEG